ncbi:MAG: hypothetical protein ACRD8Z_09120, partial [Nitrososphaeraceae archaeon]
PSFSGLKSLKADFEVVFWISVPDKAMVAKSFIEKAKIRIIPTTWIVNILVTLNEILKLHTMYFKELIYAS